MSNFASTLNMSSSFWTRANLEEQRHFEEIRYSECGALPRPITEPCSMNMTPLPIYRQETSTVKPLTPTVTTVKSPTTVSTKSRSPIPIITTFKTPTPVVGLSKTVTFSLPEISLVDKPRTDG